MKHKIFLIIINSFLLSFLNCSKQTPDEPPNAYFEMNSVENVIQNLQQAYNEQNPEKYLECFSEDFQMSGTPESWGKAEERQCHQKMFQGENKVKSVQLTLTPFGKPVEDEFSGMVSVSYHYSLQINTAGDQTDEAYGNMSFVLKMNEAGQRKIVYEREDSPFLKMNFSADSDSVDYFPLQVGNWWYYESDPPGWEWDYRHNIIGTAIFDNLKYYTMQITPITADSQHFTRIEYFRKDTLDQIWHKISENDSAQLLYRLTVTPGDTWQYNDKDGFYNQITLFDTSAVSPSTYLGKFQKCKEYWCLDDTELYFQHWLAPGMGVVYRTSEGVSFSLRTATVNNVKYPSVTAVEKRTWEKIKYYFFNL